MKKTFSNIIISRTDSIGDVVLTLPMAKALKDLFPAVKIYFLGKEYTRSVINTCIYCDEFIELDDFLNDDLKVDIKSIDTIIHVRPNAAIAKKAKQLKIKTRIGTTNRLYHWSTCNTLVKLSRKNSDLHEAQLNLKLLQPFGVNKKFSFEEIIEMYGLKNVQPLQASFQSLIDNTKYNLILHPKSQGSAREWGLENYIELIKMLDKKRCKIFISGTHNERELLQPLFNAVGNYVNDICGLMQLDQFISFINNCNGLLACSTGPLHIAAALGKNAFGIYAPLKLINPQRWAPIGKNAKAFVLNKNCNDCYKNKMSCHCIKEITPVEIKNNIDKIIFS